MFLSGISARSLFLLSKNLLGRTISHTEISQANKEMSESVEKWRQRDLSREGVKYLFVDGVRCHIRREGKVDNIPLLIAVVFTEKGAKLVLGLHMGDKESAQVQRCKVHVAPNVLAKVPQRLKETLADGLMSIFYASSQEKAREFFGQLKGRWQGKLPSAIPCTEQSLDSCLTFFKYPPE
jgi:putative transposase